MISIETELIRAFAYWKKQSGIADAARVLFLREKSGFVLKGQINDYFFIEQTKESTGETVVYLRMLNTEANRNLLAASTAITFRDYNPFYDNYIYNLSKIVTIPSAGLSILRRIVLPTGNKYAGAG